MSIMCIYNCTGGTANTIKKKKEKKSKLKDYWEDMSQRS